VNARSTVTDSLLSDLQKIEHLELVVDQSLAAISRWRIGGKADLIVRPTSIESLVKVRKYFYRQSIPHFVFGQSSNLLFADDGLRVPCIQIGNRIGNVKVDKTAHSLTAQAGAWVPIVARLAMQAGMSGIEHICGIPGTFGGLICMNGGSKRQSVGDSAIQIISVALNGELLLREKSECFFSYRHSIFQENEEVVISATLKLKPGEPKEIRAEMLSILSERRKKFPSKVPNCGSVFKSNPEMYKNFGTPGAIIEGCGFKGMQIGDAIVSPLHANFILNLGKASAQDVLTLIENIYQAVKSTIGYEMQSEVCFVDSLGKAIPATDLWHS